MTIVRTFPRGFWREFSVVNVTAAVIAGVVSTITLVEVTRDPYADSPFIWVGIAAPAFTALIITIEQLLQRREFSLNQFSFRLFGLNGIFALATTVVHVVAGWQPAREAAAAEVDSRYTDPVGILVQALLGFDLLGYGAALLMGALALIAIVMPVLSLRRPKEYARVNALDTTNLKAARVSGISLSVLLLLVFVIPTLIVFGSRFDNPTMVVVGWALLPVGIIALIVTGVTQRPDAARRAKARGE
jgi:uncharacterized membrane protein